MGIQKTRWVSFGAPKTAISCRVPVGVALALVVAVANGMASNPDTSLGRAPSKSSDRSLAMNALREADAGSSRSTPQPEYALSRDRAEPIDVDWLGWLKFGGRSDGAMRSPPVSDPAGQPELAAEARAMVADPEEYAAERWQGYLKEKGPSRVLVRVEDQTDPAPLSPEIWDLINGKGDEAERESERRANEASNEVAADDPAEIENPRDPDPSLIAGGDDDGDGAVESRSDLRSAPPDSEPDSYERLMSLLSRPVVTVPASEEDDAAGIISFRVPSDTVQPMIREGSRARFQIRGE